MSAAVQSEMDIVVRVRGKFELSGVLEPTCVGADMKKHIVSLIESYEHRTCGEFINMNLDIKNFVVIDTEVNSLGVYVVVETQADYVRMDVSGEPIIEFTIEDIQQGKMLLRSEFFKFYMESKNIPGYVLFKEDKNAETLVSNRDKKLYPGKKLLIKIKSYTVCDKEDTFIVDNGEFVEADI